jgi:hypothetical protein
MDAAGLATVPLDIRADVDGDGRIGSAEGIFALGETASLFLCAMVCNLLHIHTIMPYKKDDQSASFKLTH